MGQGARVKGVGCRVEVENLHKCYRIDTNLVKRIVQDILKFVKRPRDLELGVFFLSDREIKALNKQYKKRDRPTDVLSFAIVSAGSGGGVPMGEIFISVDRARRNCKLYKNTIEDELMLYVIHGILHLFGYDDLKSDDRNEMSEKQEEVLKFLREKRNLSKVLTRR